MLTTLSSIAFCVWCSAAFTARGVFSLENVIPIFLDGVAKLIERILQRAVPVTALYNDATAQPILPAWGRRFTYTHTGDAAWCDVYLYNAVAIRRQVVQGPIVHTGRWGACKTRRAEYMRKGEKWVAHVWILSAFCLYKQVARGVSLSAALRRDATGYLSSMIPYV